MKSRCIADWEQWEEPADVPAYARPYQRFSIRFFNQLRDQLDSKTAEIESLLAEDEANALNQERLASIEALRATLDNQRTAFVDDVFCNKAGLYIDRETYHEDQAASCAEEIATLSEFSETLMENETDKVVVAREIDRQTRFMNAHRRKAQRAKQERDNVLLYQQREELKRALGDIGEKEWRRSKTWRQENRRRS